MKTSHQPHTTSFEDHGIRSHKVCVFALFLNFFLSLPHFTLAHPSTSFWLGAASSLKTDASNCTAVICFDLFSLAQVFLHLGIPSSSAGHPAGFWTKVNGVLNGVTKGETILVVHFFISKNTQIITSPCSSLYEHHFTRVSAQ